MDALPIKEINNFEYKSNNPGVSHKCGHDGHTTILLSLAQKLSENPIAGLKIYLLFQASEENGKGAMRVIEDEKFNEIKPDMVFALHNLPGYPLHQVIIKDDSFNASVISMIIKLKGKTAHAAEPENGQNPSLTIAEVIKFCDSLSNNNPDIDDFTVITPIFTNIGEIAYGTAAGEGETHFTIRTWTEEQMKSICQLIERKVSELSDENQLSYHISYDDQFQANHNQVAANELIKEAAKTNKLDVLEKDEPFKWGEDFGAFSQRFHGAMFGLGAGKETPALHNPDYDFPDELIETGSKIFYAVAKFISDERVL
jgi:amidohydrolase